MDVKNSKRFLPEGKHLMMGNIAMSEGAIAAGLKFFGGYPITPSTEVRPWSFFNDRNDLNGSKFRDPVCFL
jgi:TPP-dependent indolepyruvate ferredoxin oxidoreductase alpha subunit